MEGHGTFRVASAQLTVIATPQQSDGPSSPPPYAFASDSEWSRTLAAVASKVGNRVSDTSRDAPWTAEMGNGCSGSTLKGDGSVHECDAMRSLDSSGAGSWCNFPPAQQGLLANTT